MTFVVSTFNLDRLLAGRLKSRTTVWEVWFIFLLFYLNSLSVFVIYLGFFVVFLLLKTALSLLEVRWYMHLINKHLTYCNSTKCQVTL